METGREGGTGPEAEAAATVTGSWLGDVIAGLLLVFVASSLVTYGLFLPLGWALGLFVALASGFVGLQLPGRGWRTGIARLVRSASLRLPLARLLAVSLLTLMVGWGLGGIVHLWLAPAGFPLVFPAEEWLERFARSSGRRSVAAVYLVGVVPLIEELGFRGWVLGALERRWGSGTGVVVSACLFAVLHLSATPALALIPLFLGLVFGAAVVRTGSVWSGVLLHGTWNGALLAALLELEELDRLWPLARAESLPLLGAAVLTGSLLLFRLLRPAPEYPP